MRRTTGASESRLCRRVCAVPLTVGMLLGTVLSGGGGLAGADPGRPESIAALVAAVANANQKLQDLGAAVQQQQESVNKALVDVQTARDAAAAAQREVNASQQGVKDANAAIVAAQRADRGGGDPGRLDGLAEPYEQPRVRADLDEDPVAVGEQGPHRVL